MGVSFVDQGFGAAVADLSEALKGPHGQTVFFANAATLNIAHNDDSYRHALNSASFMFGDGTGVRWAAKVRGFKLQANLNGTDIVPELIQANPGLRVYLLGGTEEMLGRAVRGFAKLYPKTRLVGWRNGYFDHEDCAEVVDEINAAAPQLLLVGFGNPLQERWIAANRRRLKVPLTAAVGGLFAYWAGTLDRAPRLYRNLGMEWVHILLRQPHKASRYLIGNPLFLMRMLAWLPTDLARRPVRALARRISVLAASLGSSYWATAGEELALVAMMA
jgi:N-acetylglucosaminyldiphosphoundecaprenol N-acetyl-beta-D-mannosaminyltransferase